MSFQGYVFYPQEGLLLPSNKIKVNQMFYWKHYSKNFPYQ